MFGLHHLFHVHFPNQNLHARCHFHYLNYYYLRRLLRLLHRLLRPRGGRLPDFLRGVVHFWMRRMTHISASGARFRSRPLSRVVLFEPHEAPRASILALAHFQNRRWYHRSPQSTLLGVVVLGRKQLGKQAAGFVLLFLRDDLSDARRRREKKGERRFVRRRSVVAVFSGGILKRRAAKRNRRLELRTSGKSNWNRLSFFYESFGKEKEGKKKKTHHHFLFRRRKHHHHHPLSRVRIWRLLFSTRLRRKKEKTTT